MGFTDRELLKEMDDLRFRMAAVLLSCQDAIKTLDENALGRADSGGAEWPIRDELLDAIGMVLGQSASLVAQHRSEATPSTLMKGQEDD